MTQEHPYRPKPEQQHIPWQLPSNVNRLLDVVGHIALHVATYMKRYVIGVGVCLGAFVGAFVVVWTVTAGAFRIGEYLCNKMGFHADPVGEWLLGFVVVTSMLWAPLFGSLVGPKSKV